MAQQAAPVASFKYRDRIYYLVPGMGGVWYDIYHYVGDRFAKRFDPTYKSSQEIDKAARQALVKAGVLEGS